MKNFIILPHNLERKAPPFSDNHDKFPESLVRYFLTQHTKPDDNIFDPFMGLGTTAFVAEEMNRIPYGTEYNKQRFQWITAQLQNPTHIKNCDAGNIDQYAFPKIDFAITSPPYMPCHHKWNPLYAGNPAFSGYEKYLKRLGVIFTKLSQIMKKRSYIIIQADNLEGRRYTPLVQDISNTVSQIMRLENEIVVQWENPVKDYTHTHCLVFKNL